jgi:methylthioribose-1-phosphate isomerase
VTTAKSIEWVGGTTGLLRLLDQTELPGKLTYKDCRTTADVWEAIRSLRVRGAPAIGVAAAFGLLLAIRESASRDALTHDFSAADTYLRTSRPTAVNLFWALDRMVAFLKRVPADAPPASMRARLLEEAQRIQSEDGEICRAIGRVGSDLVPDGGGVLTHCNTGGLATTEYGTALSVLFTAHDQGKRFKVYADETRPLLQGARLTAWELMQAGIDVTLICDSMAAQVMREGRVQMVVVGADRIARNGDTANKIGTYMLAVLAKYHGVPFYVAAPVSTFDRNLPTGEGIPIEQRPGAEITSSFGRTTAPENVNVYNPAFDVTPHTLITGLIIESGLVLPVNETNITKVLG